MLKCNKGFTLIEVLISLAILAIISVALLLLFNGSFDRVIKTGTKAKDIYKRQKTLEEKIAVDGTSGSDSFALVFRDMTGSGPDKEINVIGEIITEKNLTVFKSDYKEEPINEPIDEPIDEPTAVSVTGVELDANFLTLSKGATHRFTVQIFPEDATDQRVTWESSDPKYVAISSEGVVTGIKKTKDDNDVFITVTTADRGLTATCQVTVTNK
jgi:prepilin-type N-terminal cleavage/methylation domain-containing protein